MTTSYIRDMIKKMSASKENIYMNASGLMRLIR